MDWNDSADRHKLAEWAVNTWTMEELYEHAIQAIVGRYYNDPGQFEQDLELKKAEEEEGE
tara:strand:- start:2177 stop:2356 length:180 start_codon:yes stop_codon:yes gene_type:complete